jgi:SnoaL-like protein
MALADLSLVEPWVGLEVSRELYDQVRALWAHHCDRENDGDVDGILTTLTDDCEYHVVNTGTRWRGHAGAREFYRGLLAAFTDVLWVPEVLVIGPQGVFDVVVLNGRQIGEWAGTKASAERVSLRLLIWFPWSAAQGKFAGERIYLQPVTPDSALLPDELGKSGDAAAILKQLARKTGSGAQPPRP